MIICRVTNKTDGRTDGRTDGQLFTPHSGISSHSKGARIKQTLRQLRDSNDLFLNDSITLAEDKRTSLAKADDSNKILMAINTAHIKRGTTRIGFAQHGRNAAYSFGSAFNRTIKKINKKKHVSFATHNKVHHYINNEQPIMVTYDSGADGHHISKKDWRKAGLPIL